MDEEALEDASNRSTHSFSTVSTWKNESEQISNGSPLEYEELKEDQKRKPRPPTSYFNLTGKSLFRMIHFIGVEKVKKLFNMDCIGDISNESSCFVCITNTIIHDYRLIVIEGSPNNLLKAAFLIEELLADDDDKVACILDIPDVFLKNPTYFYYFKKWSHCNVVTSNENTMEMLGSSFFMEKAVRAAKECRGATRLAEITKILDKTSAQPYIFSPPIYPNSQNV